MRNPRTDISSEGLARSNNFASYDDFLAVIGRIRLSYIDDRKTEAEKYKVYYVYVPPGVIDPENNLACELFVAGDYERIAILSDDRTFEPLYGQDIADPDSFSFKTWLNNINQRVRFQRLYEFLYPFGKEIDAMFRADRSWAGCQSGFLNMTCSMGMLLDRVSLDRGNGPKP